MIQTSKNNHYRSDAIFPTPTIYLGKPVFTGKTLLEEAIQACIDIRDLYSSKTIYLGISGGIDSDCVVQSFIHSRVPFKPYICYFVDYDRILLNVHETSIAETLCKDYKITPIKLEFNILDILDRRLYMKYIEDSDIYCSSEAIAIQMLCHDKLDGITINSGQVPGVIHPEGIQKFLDWLGYWKYSYNLFPEKKKYSNRERLADKIYLRATSDTADYSFERYMRKRGGGICNFFYWSPEMLGAALSSKHYKHHMADSYHLKYSVYQDQGYNISPRPLKKQNGFEEVHKIYGGYSSYYSIFRETLAYQRSVCYDYNLIDLAYYIDNGCS